MTVDPVVGEADAAAVELFPEALVANTSFGDMATVFPKACVGAAVAPLVGSLENSIWLGSILLTLVGCLAAVGDPVVGEIDPSTVELKVAPEASTRDEACALGSILSTKVLVLAALVATASSNGVAPIPVGAPALVGEVDDSTVEVVMAPEASSRDEVCALGSILSTKVLVDSTVGFVRFG